MNLMLPRARSMALLQTAMRSQGSACTRPRSCSSVACASLRYTVLSSNSDWQALIKYLAKGMAPSDPWTSWNCSRNLNAISA